MLVEALLHDCLYDGEKSYNDIVDLCTWREHGAIQLGRCGWTPSYTPHVLLWSWFEQRGRQTVYCSRTACLECCFFSSQLATTGMPGIPSHPYYYMNRMQMCPQDLTKISPRVRNSTPIIAKICLRLDIASPQHLDRSLFAFIRCFLTEKMSPRPPRARHAHRAHRKIHAEL